MTDKPIDIPSLIDQTRHAHIQGVSRRQAVPILGQCLAALEQAQAEIDREKARADAAEAALDEALRDAKQERKRAQEILAGGNALYGAIIKRLKRHFPSDTRALEWDVLPSTVSILAQERESSRAENARLREALGAAVVSMSTAITDLTVGRPSYAASELTSAKLNAVAALAAGSAAATPPAAETAGQGDGVTSVWGDGLRFAPPPATQQNEEDALTKYERLAEQFYRDTGMMAPGKDAPGQREDTFAERQAAWGEWLAKRMCKQQGEQQEARP